MSRNLITGLVYSGVTKMHFVVLSMFEDRFRDCLDGQTYQTTTNKRLGSVIA